MDFLQNNCKLYPNEDANLNFSCGDRDLDDFFLNDAIKYERQLLGKTFCFRLKSDWSVIVCMFTLSNASVDSRKLPNSRRKKLTENIPHEKSLSSYPAALIGRLGVNKEFGGKGIGAELIKYIKQLILLPTQMTACRYLTVDAYNNPSVLKFYETNGFQKLFSTDLQEKEHIGMSQDRELKTKLMFYDLMRT